MSVNLCMLRSTLYMKMKPAEEKNGGLINVSYFNETTIGGRSSFRSSDKKMEPQNGRDIFTERNGIHIIDLQKTVKQIEKAYDFVKK